MINTRRYEAANKYAAIVFEEFDTIRYKAIVHYVHYNVNQWWKNGGVSAFYHIKTNVVDKL